MFLGAISFINGDQFKDWVIQQRSVCYIEYVVNIWPGDVNRCPANEIGIFGSEFGKYASNCLENNQPTFESKGFTYNGLYVRGLEFFKHLEQFMYGVAKFFDYEISDKIENIIYLPDLSNGSVSSDYPEEIRENLNKGLCILFGCKKVKSACKIICKHLCKNMKKALWFACTIENEFNAEDLEDFKNAFNKLKQIGCKMEYLEQYVNKKINDTIEKLNGESHINVSDDDSYNHYLVELPKSQETDDSSSKDRGSSCIFL
jgi:hypothetical protein